MKFKFSRLRRAAFCCLVGLVSPAFAQTSVAVLSWSEPPTNDDGSPLTDLAGYYIYSGSSPDALIPTLFVQRGWVVLYYPIGSARYFGVTAINVDGSESAMTPVVVKTF